MTKLPTVPPIDDAAAIRSLGVSNHIKRHGIPATARAIGVECETLTDWFKRYSRYASARLASAR